MSHLNGMARQTHVPKQASNKRGTLRSFNVSPKGSFEGLLVEDAEGLIQINFPREWSSTIAEFARPGGKIQAEVEVEETHGHPAHPVYRLLSIKAEKKTISLETGNGASKNSFQGTIERLNYALHGEVNGAILDTGDFLHVKPHGAAALNLEVGMKVKGSGHRKPMVGGCQVIEAEEVNGVHLQKKPKKKAPHRA